MNGSRTIRILKRDSRSEDFSAPKLAAVMARAMSDAGQGDLRHAIDLAWAIEMYLDRSGCEFASSAAIFEMTVKVLHRVRMARAAKAMEAWRRDRAGARRRLRVDHGASQTWWDRSWLVCLGAQSWKLQTATARIISGMVERQLLAAGGSVVSRAEVVERFNVCVCELGLADAVEVRSSESESVGRAT